MGKNEQDKVGSVLELLRKQAPLTVEQEKFCNTACVNRFLKAKGGNVKKAAKHLRGCLSWRESFGTENLVADEFSVEIPQGYAYLAGQDEESRPVMIFRIKQDYSRLHSQKLLFSRLLVFTLEVVIGTMPRNVEQFVVLFDGSYFRSGSSFLNLLAAALKVIGQYYPERLHRAFIIDPPSIFSYLWKGTRPFVNLSHLTSVVSSMDFEAAFNVDGLSSSLRFSSSITSKIRPSTSSRFTFNVSHATDSLKPWYLSFGDTSASKVGPALISPVGVRSRSFGSPATILPRGITRKAFFPSTPLPVQRPSFLKSPTSFFRKDCQVGGGQVSTRNPFAPYLKLYMRPYDEMAYRTRMKQHHSRRHASASQCF